MENFDLKKYQEQLEKIKAELENKLNIKEEVSSGQKIVDTNVAVSEKEKNEAMQSALKDSKQVYKKLKSKIRKLKVKSFFKKILGALIVGTGWIPVILTGAAFLAFIGGLVTTVGAGAVALGASIANNAGLFATSLKVFITSAAVGGIGAVASGLGKGFVVDKFDSIEEFLNVGYDMVEPLPTENADIMEVFNDAKDMYKNLKIEGRNKGKIEEVTI